MPCSCFLDEHEQLHNHLHTHTVDGIVLQHRSELPGTALLTAGANSSSTTTTTSSSSSSNDHVHTRDDLKVGDYDSHGFFRGNEVLPERHSGWKEWLWPRWVRPHPWYDILPIHHVSLRHSARHYNSTGVNNATAGLLTLLTQGFKAVAIAIAYAFLKEDNQTDVFLAVLAGMGGVGLLMLAIWLRVWSHDIPNCIISIINWSFYINGWVLSSLTLFLRFSPSPIALAFVLIAPVYVSLRTIAFFPRPLRRTAFLLAAISNRSLPLAVNFHVVGPVDTVQSHRFLALLNLYSDASTVISKIVTFALQSDMAAYMWVIHIIHLILTVYANTFQVRCRQIALDSFANAVQKLGKADFGGSLSVDGDDVYGDNNNNNNATSATATATATTSITGASAGAGAGGGAGAGAGVGIGASIAALESNNSDEGEDIARLGKRLESQITLLADDDGGDDNGSSGNLQQQQQQQQQQTGQNRHQRRLEEESVDSTDSLARILGNQTPIVMTDLQEVSLESEI